MSINNKILRSDTGPSRDLSKLRGVEIYTLYLNVAAAVLRDRLKEGRDSSEKSTASQAYSELETILLNATKEVISLENRYTKDNDNLLIWTLNVLQPSVIPIINPDALSKALEELEYKILNTGLFPVNYAAVEPLIFAIINSIPDARLITQEYPMIKSWYNKHGSDRPFNNILKDITLLDKFYTVQPGELPRKINPINVIEYSSLKRAESLPEPNKENILVTSALPYVNNSPHIGNIIGSVLSADAFVKYCRIRGKNCIYVCGTDEYGTATEVRAFQENTSCKKLCDRYFLIHKKIYEWFDIDFDCFGRTSTDNHTKLTQEFYSDLKQNGYIIKKDVEQLYCNKHERFLADRFVEGTCPNCNYEDARGDQCDQCGNVFDSAVSIVNPKCKVDGSTPVIKDTKHLFLDLTTLTSKLREWADNSSTTGNWSQNNISILNSWFNVGLKPRCITRDLSWGVPVNEDGYNEKVFYVWFDACIGYPSITANHIGEDWKKWWKNPENVKLYQFMGKDNSSFHTIVFPSMQLGTGKNWTMLHHIDTTEFLQYEGGKFSKSRGYGVFGDDLMKLDIPSSIWRYYLLTNRPEKADTKFSWDQFANSNNNELLGSLGNLINRVLKFTEDKYNSVVPEYSITGPSEGQFIQSVNVLLAQYIKNFDAVKIRNSVKIALETSNLGNKYLQDVSFNNKLHILDPQACSNVVGVSLNFIYLIAALFYPFTTGTSIKIYKQLNAPPRRIEDLWTCSDILPGHCIGKSFHLFKPITPKYVETLKKRFGAGEKYSGSPVVSSV